MSDDRPKVLTLSPEALFRARVIALVVMHLARLGKVSDAVRLVAGTPVPTHVPGRFRAVSERTIWRWWKAHQTGGGQLDALEPRTRRAQAPSALSDAQVAFFVAEKLEDPAASIPELIRKAKELGVFHAEAAVCRSTVWRALRRRKVVTGRGKEAAMRDSRRYTYRHRMQMVLADFKHFRVGPTGRKRLALYFIDDATRYVLGVLVTTVGESVRDVLELFHQVVVRYGRMSALYVDNGSGFKANVLEQVALNFDPPTAVIHGTPNYPEGRAKVERFNRSVKARVLRHLRKEGIDSDPGALTVRLQHDVDFHNADYHEGIDAVPRDRWEADRRGLQPVKDERDLRRIFTVALENPSKVSADHVVRVGGESYEVPRGYARRWIQVYRRVLEATESADALYIDHEGAMLRLHPVDPHFNAHDRRATYRATPEPTSLSNTTSAAELAFARDLGPITDADGGYHDDNEEQ